MQSKAKTVTEYLAELPDDRREIIQALRKIIKKNLSKEYKEGMLYGAIGYYIPHSVYPPGYHCNPEIPLPFAGMASQKNYVSLSLMCVYGDEDHASWFKKAWKKTGKKLDMGKSCIRIKKLEDVAFDVLGQAIKKVPAKKFIANYEAVLKPPAKIEKSPAVKKSKKK